MVLSASAPQPSPDVRGARLIATRSHHGEQHVPTARQPWDHAGVLVRPYVACLGADIYAGAQTGLFGGEQWW
ncbi:hypothetical protein AMK31_17690 [Streptomyces sp. TSRI0107]|nr:hypothetical protein AMK31_17690 [Streptomyces sp. TSRI0107]